MIGLFMHVNINEFQSNAVEHFEQWNHHLGLIYFSGARKKQVVARGVAIVIDGRNC